MKCKASKCFICVATRTVIVLVFLVLSYFHFADSLELLTLDLRFQLRPPLKTTEDLVIIEIGDYTIKELGAFPFVRENHQVLIDALKAHGAKAIIFDFFFSEPQDDDPQFEKAIKSAGNVYLPYAFELNPKKKNRVAVANGYTGKSLPYFMDIAKGTGHINVSPGIDGKFRRVPLFVSYQEKMVPYLSFLAGTDILGIPREDIKLVAGRYAQCGKDLRIPLDEESNLIVNFSGKWGEGYQHFSYVDIVTTQLAVFLGQEPPMNLDVFKDKICIIGLTATGTTDLHPNPYDALYPAVGMLADVYNSVLTNKFIHRASRIVNFIILTLFVILVSWITCRTKPLKGLLIVLGMAFVYGVMSVLLFNFFGLWIDMFLPIFAMAFVYLYCIVCKYIDEWKSRLILENELLIARRIQQSFLPKEIPASEEIEIAADMFTARQVGGDLYDFVKFEDGRLGVMIGDVSGKGVPASLFMAMSKSAFNFYARPEVSPQETLCSSNDKIIKDSSSSLFVTVFYSLFDLDKKTMCYASGGHLPTLHLSHGKSPSFLDVEEGLPLGLMEGPYSGNEVSFQSGDVFVFYTDGVTEAKNPDDEMYGDKRLLDVAQKNKDGCAAEILLAIADDVRKFEPPSSQHDDITVLVIKIT